MSRRSARGPVGRRRGAVLAVFAVLCATIALDRWAVSSEPLAHDRLRLARTELQRAESLHATLAADPVRLRTMALSEEALSLAILERAARANGVFGVSDLQYRLLTDSGEIGTLRLTLQARVLDGDALLQLLDALRTAAVTRPRRVAGCRVLRVPAPERDAVPTDTIGPATLALECAIDWSWWPVA